MKDLPSVSGGAGGVREASLQVNGQPVKVPARESYVTVERLWRKGDTVELDFPMLPRLTEPHPRSDSTRGCVAIERGPIVYCLEQCDQEPSVNDVFMDVQIDETAALRTAWRGDLLGGVMVVEAVGHAADVDSWQDRLYRPARGRGDSPRRPVRLTAVPYHVWANRGPGAMRVWIPRVGRKT